MGMRQQRNGNEAGSLIDVSCEDMEVMSMRLRGVEERHPIHLYGQMFPSNHQHRTSQCGCQFIYYIHHLGNHPGRVNHFNNTEDTHTDLHDTEVFGGHTSYVQSINYHTIWRVDRGQLIL